MCPVSEFRMLHSRRVALDVYMGPPVHEREKIYRFSELQFPPSTHPAAHGSYNPK